MAAPESRAGICSPLWTADILIHPDTFIVIDHFLSSDAIVVGRPARRSIAGSAGLLALWAVFSAISFLTRIDTGVVYCRRTDFELVGGYDERYRAAEDVAFLVSLWRLAWTRGQWVVRLGASWPCGPRESSPNTGTGTTTRCLPPFVHHD